MVLGIYTHYLSFRRNLTQPLLQTYQHYFTSITKQKTPIENQQGVLKIKLKVENFQLSTQLPKHVKHYILHFSKNIALHSLLDKKKS